MSNHQERLKRLNAQYQKTAGVKPSGFLTLDKGSYQIEIAEAKYIAESKAPFALGEMEIRLQGKILTGPSKGAKTSTNFFLEQAAKGDRPSGMALFKGVLEALGISMPGLSEKALAAVCRELKGVRFEGYAPGKGNNVYFNKAIDNEDVGVDDEDLEVEDDSVVEDATEDAEETEEEEVTEEEEEEAPKPAPKVAPKTVAKPPASKPIVKPSASNKTAPKPAAKPVAKPALVKGNDDADEDSDELDDFDL